MTSRAQFWPVQKPPSKCPNCDETGPHFVAPSFGDEGFFTCEKKGGARSELERIRKQADDAVEAPWRSSDFGLAGDQEPTSVVIHSGKFNWDAIYRGPESEEAADWDGEYIASLDVDHHTTAEFIADSRTNVPRLVAALLAVAEANDRYMRGEISGTTLSIDIHAALESGHFQ